MKFISKSMCCLVMENVAFFVPHLRKNIFQIYIQHIFQKNKNISRKEMVGLPFTKTETFEFSDTQISKIIFLKMIPYFSCIF